MKKLQIQRLLIIFLLSAIMHIGYSQEAKVQKITDNVYAISIFHYNSLVVIGDQGVLLVDPANVYRAELLKKEIKKLTDLSVSHIVLSHEHYDHVGGTEVFPGAQIYAQNNAQSVFKLDVTGAVPKRIHNWFDTDATIVMGKTRVNLHHFGAGDGVATAVVHLPKEKVVYSADMFEAGALTDRRFIEDYNPLGIKLILNNLVSFSPKYIVNGHSPDMDSKHLIRASKFYNDLYDAVAAPVLEASKGGAYAVLEVIEKLKKEIKLDEYKDLQNYDHLPTHIHRMAMAVFHGG